MGVEGGPGKCMHSPSIKEALTASPVLSLFDPNLKTIIVSADTSSLGGSETESEDWRAEASGMFVLSHDTHREEKCPNI